MSWIILPLHVQAAIFDKIDAQLKLHPEFQKDRENIYQDLLEYYDRTGEAPDFKLEPRVAHEDRGGE